MGVKAHMDRASLLYLDDL